MRPGKWSSSLPGAISTADDGYLTRITGGGIEVSTTGFEVTETYPDDRSALLESPQYGKEYYGNSRYGKEMLDIVDPGLDPVWEGKVAPAAVVDDIVRRSRRRLLN